MILWWWQWSYWRRWKEGRKIAHPWIRIQRMAIPSYNVRD